MFSRSARALFLIALFLCLGLSGCIYLRLLKVKGQLKRFDDYFELAEQEEMFLVFREPVLYSEDVVKLMESPPTYRIEHGRVLALSYVLEKQYQLERDEEGRFDIQVGFVFRDNKLNQMVIDHKIFSFFPKGSFANALKALGGGTVDQRKRELTSKFESYTNQEPLTVSKIESLLGVPYAIDGNRYWYKYYYKPPPSVEVEKTYSNVYITFDEDSGEMLECRTLLFGARLEMSFEEPEIAEEPVEVFDDDLDLDWE